MKTFKIKTGNCPIYNIDKDLFETLTKRKDPYYPDNKIENGQFAVCPKCDNPIRIIGMYEIHKNNTSAYGKHHTKSIPNLAKYRQSYYDDCPLASKNRHIDKGSRRSELLELEINIYNLMREHFDKVVYVLQKSVDIKFGEKTLRKLLTAYIHQKGYMYKWAYLNNIPYMLGYIPSAKPILGQFIKVNSALHNAIKSNCKNAAFEKCCYDGYERLTKKGNNFLDLNFVFLHHSFTEQGNDTIETLEFEVFETKNSKNKTIFKKTLIVDEQYFLNLVNNYDNWHENEHILNIAREIMPELV